jgi:hypothetical protein
VPPPCPLAARKYPISSDVRSQVRPPSPACLRGSQTVIWLAALLSVAFELMLLDDSIHCTECHRDVDEFTAIKERWTFWSDGRDLLPYCPDCSEREFAPDARASLSRSGDEPRRGLPPSRAP